MAMVNGWRRCASPTARGRGASRAICWRIGWAIILFPTLCIAGAAGVCALRGSFVEADASQRTSIENVYCAGEPTGIAGLEAALVQGEHCRTRLCGHARNHAAQARGGGAGFCRPYGESVCTAQGTALCSPAPIHSFADASDVAFGDL